MILTGYLKRGVSGTFSSFGASETGLYLKSIARVDRSLVLAALGLASDLHGAATLVRSRGMGLKTTDNDVRILLAKFALGLGQFWFHGLAARCATRPDGRRGFLGRLRLGLLGELRSSFPY